MKIIFCAIAVFIIFYSCKKSSSSIALGSMSLTINSKSYNLLDNATNDTIHNDLIIKGTQTVTDSGKIVIIEFSGKGFIVKDSTYSIGEQGDYMVWLVAVDFTDSMRIFQANSKIGYGSVTISNITRESVQGSFSFTAENDTTKKVESAKGSFNAAITMAK